VALSKTLKRGARLRVVNASQGAVLAERVDVAATPWGRLRGLLGRPLLQAGEGLLIVPCQSVHMLGMAYPIDVVYLDPAAVVLKVVRGLRPWRLGPLVWRSHMVLELAGGTAASTSVGDQLLLEPLDSAAGLS
jgi:uncharacterized protein